MGGCDGAASSGGGDAGFVTDTGPGWLVILKMALDCAGVREATDGGPDGFVAAGETAEAGAGAAA